MILELPAVPVDGETGISEGQGSLVFGIGTQSNNGLGSAVVLTIDSNPSDDAYTGFTTVYNGVTRYPSTSDVGSAAFSIAARIPSIFLDQAITGIPDCSCNVGYCPTSTENLTATNQATGGNSTAVQFSVATPTPCRRVSPPSAIWPGRTRWVPVAEPVAMGFSIGDCPSSMAGMSTRQFGM